MPNVLETVAHRPYPLPAGPWRMAQRWNDLLFAHWPISPQVMASLLPAGLEVDTFDGQAWVGVVPFWMDRVRTRIAGETTVTVPGTATFAELNLRTYVRSRRTGLQGVFFFSLDAESLLAVIGARTIFHLPYFLSDMKRVTYPGGSIQYSSTRMLTRQKPSFRANYRGLGRKAGAAASLPGSLEYFLTERYCLFTTSGSRLLVGHIHHLPWPLEPAEAEIEVNDLPQAHGLTLPNQPPILHFSRELEVFIWSLAEEL
jgi:uncharacterized protein YqjF (DUF2071 family)